MSGRLNRSDLWEKATNVLVIIVKYVRVECGVRVNSGVGESIKMFSERSS